MADERGRPPRDSDSPPCDGASRAASDAAAPGLASQDSRDAGDDSSPAPASQGSLGAAADAALVAGLLPSSDDESGDRARQKLQPRRIMSPEEARRARLTRAITIAADKGMAGKAMATLLGQMLLELTDGPTGTVKLLKAKYPPTQRDAPLERLPLPKRVVPTEPKQIDKQKLEDEKRLADFTPLCWEYLRIRSHRKGGHGTSGWSFAKLALAFNNSGAEPPNLPVKPLAQLVLHLHDGRADHPALRAALTSQRGIALDKGDGTPRPLGIMEALTRLASGTLTRMNRAVLAGCLHAHDYGMLPSGVEAAAMAVRLHAHINPQHVVIKTDIKNAFNAINRASIVVAVKKHPQLLPLHAMINTLYGDSSTVTYERRDDSPVVMDAEEGVVQGEPMASALFEITYSDILAPLRARAAETGCVIITIHDDTYIVGPPEAAFELYDQLRPALAPHGLVEQPNKGLAFSRTTDDTLINLDVGGGAGHFIPGTVNALASLREFALSADGLIVGGVPVD